MVDNMYYDDPPATTSTTRSSKLPFINFAARIATFAPLIVSIVILKTNKKTWSDSDSGKDYRLAYQDYLAYKYMFYVSAIGIVYSLYQTPFALYYLKTRKRLIHTHIFKLVDFYGDKVMAFLLGSAVGAAFGATGDLKDKSIYPDQTDQFFDMNYIAAVFMFIGCLASLISSILSSFRLANKD